MREAEESDAVKVDGDKEEDSEMNASLSAGFWQQISEMTRLVPAALPLMRLRDAVKFGLCQQSNRRRLMESNLRERRQRLAVYLPQLP